MNKKIFVINGILSNYKWDIYQFIFFYLIFYLSQIWDIFKFALIKNINEKKTHIYGVI